MSENLRKRSITLSGHRTSVSLEDAFWRVLKDLARDRGTSVSRLIAEIDRGRRGNLSSAVRVYVLRAVAERDAHRPRPGRADG